MPFTLDAAMSALAGAARSSSSAPVAVAKAAVHNSIQWQTLAWIAGAVVAATVIIAVIVLVSRRPKSMEDGMAEFSRSLQAVAPTHRLTQRPAGGYPRPGQPTPDPERPARSRRGETEAV